MWRKLFMNIANKRDYLIKYWDSQRKFDIHLREWYLNENPNDNEVRAFYDNSIIYYIVFG